MSLPLKQQGGEFMLQKASLVKQISITVNKEIGSLDRMAGYMADRGINIAAIACYEIERENKAKIMFVVEDTARAVDALRAKGIKPVEEKEVIMVELDNKPGALKTVTNLLAHKDVNIRYVYGTGNSATTPARVILATSNNEKAYVSLKKAATA
jgi:hypothetical protein